jgi:hypothetical protein
VLPRCVHQTAVALNGLRALRQARSVEHVERIDVDEDPRERTVA